MPPSPIRSRGGPSLEAKTVLEATGCLVGVFNVYLVSIGKTGDNN